MSHTDMLCAHMLCMDMLYMDMLCMTLLCIHVPRMDTSCTDISCSMPAAGVSPSNVFMPCIDVSVITVLPTCAVYRHAMQVHALVHAARHMPWFMPLGACPNACRSAHALTHAAWCMPRHMPLGACLDACRSVYALTHAAQCMLLGACWALACWMVCLTAWLTALPTAWVNEMLIIMCIGMSDAILE